MDTTFPYRVNVNIALWYLSDGEMTKWILDNIKGEASWRSNHTVDYRPCVDFKNEKDATLFALRWS